MIQPKKIKVVSEAILARASQLHDAAFADPRIEKKPSFAESISQAEQESPEIESPAETPAPEPA